MHLSFSEKHFRSLFYSGNPRNQRKFLKPQVSSIIYYEAKQVQVKSQSSIYSTYGTLIGMVP